MTCEEQEELRDNARREHILQKQEMNNLLGAQLARLDALATDIVVSNHPQAAEIMQMVTYCMIAISRYLDEHWDG